MQEMHWDTNALSIAVPVAAHLYGETGPLEVRNAVPGDIGMDGGGQECGYEEHGTPRESVAGGTPRFLSVDGNLILCRLIRAHCPPGEGLEVPWSRQSSFDHDLSALGFRPHPAQDLSSPYLSPPDARDYFGPPFPSPPATIDEHDQPQRAGTWASNLRTSLFAAISGARGQTPTPEDKFTRQVLPLHRNSTQRQAFPIIREEKDADMIGSVFLAPSGSTDTDMTLPQRPQRLPLRDSVGERYKRYARSQRSNDQDDESCASWSSVEDLRLPSRLAGGEKARGVRGYLSG